MELSLDKSLLVRGERVAVALSGGRDSVALLFSILDVAEECGIEVKAVHVEHGIRGEESLQDEKFVVELCKKYSVPLKTARVDVPKERENYGSIEETARALRYAVFESALDEGFCDKIATAHHESDNAETVLMRIFRGTGINGLIGIKSERGRYIRPFLAVTRAQIDEYIADKNLPYQDDSTNDVDEYARNYVRNVVMKDIKERFPSAPSAISRLSRTAEEVDEYIRGVAEKCVEIRDGVAFIEIAEPVVVKYAVKIAYEKLGVFADVEERHLQIAESAVNGGRKVYDFPFGYRLEREENSLSLYRPHVAVGDISPKVGVNEIDGRRIIIEKVDKRTVGKLCFSADLDELRLRAKQDGDVFCRYKGGTKSLGDYFTDKKLPRRVKDKVIVLAKGSEVAVVVGVEIADGVKVDDNSKNIYSVYEEDYNVQ